jgi:ATP-dependent DNA helicase RecQ
LQGAAHFVHSFDRPNIFYRITQGDNGRQRMWEFIEENHATDAGIVYCLSRKKVEETAQWLSARGRNALPYHAGLDKDIRARHQRIFLQQEAVIIVATIAFGMGIDKPDVRFVAHLNLPKNLESYYQETGRAGRDGEAANAWMAYGLQDIINLRQMTAQSDADEQFKRVLHHKMEVMLGFCEQIGCRRQTLLEYFDETLPEPCGNCDNCSDPPQTWDATEAARMALSCVFRTGQRFGVNYVIDVLMGNERERIVQNGHDQLSTFGIGDLDNNEWRSLFRQLIALGYLFADVDNYGALKMNSSCKPLLNGSQQLHLRQFVKQARAKKVGSGKIKVTLQAADTPLFDALRLHRSELAQQQAVPPYVILHDKTLHAICELRPATTAQLAEIPGIGARKLELYGDALIRITQQYSENTPQQEESPENH